MKKNASHEGTKVPRRRFFFCTLATILFVAGTLILLGAIALFVIFKVSTRALPNSETYRQRTLYQQTDANQWDYDLQPLTIIVILASVGGALIIFASICAVISCTVYDGNSSKSAAAKTRAEQSDSEEETEEKREEQLATPLIASGSQVELCLLFLFNCCWRWRIGPDGRQITGDYKPALVFKADFNPTSWVKLC